MVAAAGFTVLPGAGRVWRAMPATCSQINPAWVNAEYEVCFFGSESFLQYVTGGKFPEGAGSDRYTLDNGILRRVPKLLT